MALSSFKTLLSEIHVVQRIENANDNRTNKLTTKHNVMSIYSVTSLIHSPVRSLTRSFTQSILIWCWCILRNFQCIICMLLYGVWIRIILANELPSKELIMKSGRLKNGRHLNLISYVRVTKFFFYLFSARSIFGTCHEPCHPYRGAVTMKSD